MVQHGRDEVYDAHVDWLQKLSTRLNTLETSMADMAARLTPVEQGVANFRQHAIDVRDFITEQRTIRTLREQEDERRDRRDNRRSNFIIAGMAVLGFLLSVLLYINTIEADKKGVIHLPKIQQSERGEKYTAHMRFQPEVAKE